MNQRLNRKDIKRDEFASAVSRSVEYAESHSRGLMITIAAVLGLVLLGSLVYYLVSHRSEQANRALATAVKVFQAPIDPAAAKPTDAKEPSFATEAARQQSARKMLDAVRADYRFTDAADVASIYLAEIDAAEGKLDAARQLWSDFVKKHGDHVLAAQARLDVMDLDRTQGKGQAVEQQLRQMLDQSNAPLPQDVILNELAVTLEQLHRDQEAAQIYQRLMDEYPQSPYRMAAQQKVISLDPTRAAAAAQLGALGGFPPS